MLNLLRKFLRPTLREQLEDGVREGLKRYANRHASPNLRVYVSTDLVPDELDRSLWARDEGEHLRRFALQWAEDNSVPRAGLRLEMILLDTKREFAFVKPVGMEPADEAVDARRGDPSAPPVPMVERAAPGTAVLVVVSSDALHEPLRISSELTVGRRAVDDSVFGVGDRYMSGRHARFHVSGGKLYVTDLDSKNRTYVNEQPVPPHDAVRIAVGDEVRMGMTTLRVAEVGE